MPIYRYICPKCGEEQTFLMRMNEENPKCPKCDVEMEKQIPRVQLKGTAGSCNVSCSSCSGCFSRS
ncbi:FmdB family zinc ribbon protein [Pseudothermotoga sp.]